MLLRSSTSIASSFLCLFLPSQCPYEVPHSSVNSAINYEVRYLNFSASPDPIWNWWTPFIIRFYISCNKPAYQVFISHKCLHQVHNKTRFFQLFLCLTCVNWAGQMSAGQTGPKKSKIKSYKFLTFFYWVADVAKYLIYVFYIIYTIKQLTFKAN